MSAHPTTFEGSVVDAIRAAIEEAIPGAQVDCSGGGGHFTIAVVSPAFAGKNRVQSQRMVYSAIAHLMQGEGAPVHAVDTLTIRTP